MWIMKSKVFVLFIAFLLFQSYSVNYDRVEAQREQTPNIIAAYANVFAMGDDSGHLTVYNRDGDVIRTRKVAEQKSGHLLVGITDLLWINSSAILYNQVHTT